MVARLPANTSESWTSSPLVASSFRSGADCPTCSTATCVGTLGRSSVSAWPWRDPGTIVRNHVDRRDLEAGPLQQLRHRGAAQVLHRPGRGPVADRQDRRLDRLLGLLLGRLLPLHGYKDMHVIRGVLFDYGL